MKHDRSGHYLTCPMCGGTGSEEIGLPTHENHTFHYTRVMTTCSFCDGLGVVFNVDCTGSHSKKVSAVNDSSSAVKESSPRVPGTMLVKSASTLPVVWH